MPKARPAVPALIGALVLLASLLVCAASALAIPITVNLRVEGATTTLFEGPVSVEGIVSPPGISTTTTPEAHPCDVKDNGTFAEGFGNSVATPTAALYDAAVSSGLSFDAKWFKSFNDFEVSQVGSDKNGGEAEGFPSWGYAVNDTTAGVGGCQFQLANGSDVLWAYNYFNLGRLLSLSGPASAQVGVPFSVHVSDAQTGQPVGSAALGTYGAGVTNVSTSSPMTDSAGNATITLTQTGTQALKATRDDSVRSNALTICVHNANDGTCGSSVISPPPPAGKAPATVQTLSVPKVIGVKGSHTYTRRRAPRLLGGTLEVPAGVTLRQVRISLQRTYRKHCSTFSGSLERFVKAKCNRTSFFAVGSSASFSYLLPTRLPAGKYTYEVQAVDSTGHLTALTPGVSLVRFDVR
jgi:hypothetical protein